MFCVCKTHFFFFFFSPHWLLKDLFSFQIVRRITDAHSNVKDLNLTDAKLAYIKAWQALPEYGITYFIIKMNTNKKEVSFVYGRGLLSFRLKVNFVDKIRVSIMENFIIFIFFCLHKLSA